MSDDKKSLREKVLFVISQKWCWGLIFILLLVVTLVNFMVIFLHPKQQVIIIDRSFLEPARENLTQTLSLPVERIVASQTEGIQCFEEVKYYSVNICLINFGSHLKAVCIAEMIRLQILYFSYGYIDIPWNYLISGDGSIYEGRGFRYQGDIPRNDSASSFDDIGLLIGFIGNFANERPRQEQRDAFKALVDLLIGRDVVTQDFTLFSQDQLIMTEPEAAGFYEALKNNTNFYERKC